MFSRIIGLLLGDWLNEQHRWVRLPCPARSISGRPEFQSLNPSAIHQIIMSRARAKQVLSDLNKIVCRQLGRTVRCDFECQRSDWSIKTIIILRAERKSARLRSLE